MKEYNSCVIIGIGPQLIAVNPNNRMQLRIRLENYPLDFYADSKGIYHASEDIVDTYPKNKEGLCHPAVKIYDSITGNSVQTIKCSDALINSNHLWLQDITFKFIKNGDTLLYNLKYNLNDLEGIIFHKFGGHDDIHSDSLIVKNKGDVYLGIKKIASLYGGVPYLKEIDMAIFESTFRSKDKQRYKKNKDFFKLN